DNVADQVVQRLTEQKGGETSQVSGGDSTAVSGEAVQAKSDAPTITSISQVQRVGAPEMEEQGEREEDGPEVQRKPIFESDGDGDSDGTLQRSGDESFQASDDFSNRLTSSKGGGQPLNSEVQRSMGDAMGADFSGVRVHEGGEAAGLSNDIGAQAFTHGSDIYFNEGKYQPGTSDGDRLLAHELTHTVQQGGSPTADAVQRADEPAASEGPPPQQPNGALDITHRFAPTGAWKAWIEHTAANSPNREVKVPVKIGNDYQGEIDVRQDSKRAAENRPGRYKLAPSKVSKHYLSINGIDFLDPIKDVAAPVLVLDQFGDEGQVTGYLSLLVGKTALPGVMGFIKGLNENLEKLKFLGLKPLKVPKAGVENKFENGRLVVQVTGLSTELDGYLKVGGGFGMVGNRFTFNLTSNVEVPGLASGELMLALDDKNELNGKATIEADIANVKATVIAEYLAGVVTIQGTGQIESEKFSGSITLLVTDKARSKQMMHAALGVESMEGEKEQAEGKPKPKTPKNQVLVGWGEVTAKVTSWLEGTVKVGIDADGHITMVGELVVPDEVELMEQRGKKIDLFEVEIRAGYGIPLVGQVFLFASIGMFVNAGFGPLVLRDVRLEGTYSTDPKILQNFKIGGTLAINAFAVVGLQAEAGVGLTLIGHDLKAGISVTAAAGLRAYALANALLEYSESQAPEGGKVGEARIKGHFEAAAQLFLQLAGSLFYEIDSPWWSPAPDGRTDHPLGEVQYPIGEPIK
ncbi:MAG: DUF4157 domain-containing protein, partial [Bacteroidota bacterium]